MDLIARITELLDEREWTQYRLAKEAKLSKTTISSMMKRGTSPSLATIEQCCNAFGITLGEFFDDGLRVKEFTALERKIIDEWRVLSPEMQSVTRQTISFAYQIARDEQKKKDT